MNKQFLFIFTFVFLIIGCDVNEISEEGHEKVFPNKIIQGCNPYAISAEEAMQQTESFVEQLRAQTRSDANTEIESVIPWLTRDIWGGAGTRGSSFEALPDTALYIVNILNNNGYALVSADSRFPGVVAFIEKGSFRPDDEIDNPGFLLFMDGLKDYYAQELQNHMVIPTRSNSPFFEFDINVEPMLATNWGQGAPYNKYCYTSDGFHAPAGCAAIAAAQIAAYYEWPESYNNHIYEWEHIMASDQVNPTDTIATNSVAHLVHDIGLLINTIYNINNSGAYLEDVANCWDEFNYDYVLNNYPSFGVIDSTLQEGSPVFFQGFTGNMIGHAWVIDGSAVRHGYLRIGNYQGVPGEYIEIQHLSFVHCNWGWNGANNGYYLYGAFESKYDEDLEQIIDKSYPFNYINAGYLGITPNYDFIW